jgi:peptidoglycan hydrolase-like protein with peptidoglycan-binding domain
LTWALDTASTTLWYTETKEIIMAGRGAWSNKGRGGTLKRLADDTTAPGPYYLLAVGESKRVGSAARDAVKAGLIPTQDDLAVNYGVKAIQKLLNLAGASPKLAEDGVFGAGTDKGVRAYQESKGLKVDGSVGPNTMKALLLPNIKQQAGSALIGGQPMWTVVYGFLANEGGFDPGAVGTVDDADLGLAQINGRAHPELSVAQRFDPIVAIQFNVIYIENAMKNLKNNLRDAVLSYNLGSGGILKWIAAGRPRYWNPATLKSSPVADVAGGFRDTKAYIDNILSAYKSL